MHRKKILAAIALLFVFSTTVFGKEASNKETLARRIDSILAKASGKWAVEAVSLKTGETLYSRNSDSSMIPASNVKLFVTAAALSYLGPDFTTKTSFYYDGELSRDGVLKGDIIIYGRGDPNISGRFTGRPSAIFEQVAVALKGAGLRKVDGAIIGDDSYFDSDYYGPWSPKESYKWYAARVSALSFNDNCVDLTVTPGASAGRRASVLMTPDTSYVKLVNRTSTTRKRSNSVWLSPLNDGRDVLVGGKIWSGKEYEVLWFPVDSPALYAATVFRETLERSGIQVSGTARALEKGHKSVVPKGSSPVLEYESYPISESIKVINKRSQNLHAELLLKQVGLHAGGGPSFEGGIDAVISFIGRAGIAPGSIILCDGSGLCRKNRATAHSIVQLLKYMNSNSLGRVFEDSLAVGGTDHSLRKMTWIVPEGKIRAKTGSLKNVLSLSGYADGKTQKIAFSIIVNDFSGDSSKMRNVRDRVCAELVSY